MDVPARDQQRPAAQVCPFLQLPIELMLSVGDYLPPQDQMMLAQTCRPMRTILGDLLKVDIREASKLPRDARLAYLASMARADPQLWLCSSCRKLHPVTDTQIERTKMPCDKYTILSFRDHLGASKFDINYCHVQLALKYTRMSGEDPAYQAAAQRLLAPHREVCYNEQSLYVEEFTVEPRIVDGLFLLRCVWDCTHDDPDFHLTLKTNHMLVCKHLRYPATPIGPRWERCDSMPIIFREAIRRLDDGEVRGSCYWCATDYSIQSSRTGFRLCAWRNLGPEGSPLNPVWRAQLDYLTKMKTPGYGAVRRMYERVRPTV